MSWHQLPAELRALIFSNLANLDDEWPSTRFRYLGIHANRDILARHEAKLVRMEAWQRARNYRLVCKNWSAEYRAALIKGRTVQTLLRLGPEDLAYAALQKFLDGRLKPGQQLLNHLLVYAIKRPYLKCMHLLLKRGAQAYLRVPGVDTCLVSLAITRRSDEACELLLSYNPPIELESAFDRIRGVHTNGPLALAVIYDMPKTAERLLQRGCSVYMVIKPPIKDFTLNYESEDILQYLAGHQRVDMLRLFVKYGLRVPNEDYVAYGKYTEAREKWVQEQMYELELDFSDLPEKHPLDIAIERDNLEIARMLLEAGAMFEDMEDVIEQVASVPMKNLLRDWLQDLEALASDSELV